MWPVRHCVLVRTAGGYRRNSTTQNSPNAKRSSRSAETAQRRPKILPICGNRATQATLPKTPQRGLSAYKYTYPVAGESSRGYKLGNRVQPGLTAGAGYSSRRRLPRRGSRVQATQPHPAYRDTTTSCCAQDVPWDGRCRGAPVFSGSHHMRIS